MCSAGASAKKVSDNYKVFLDIEQTEEDLPSRYYISAYTFPKLYIQRQDNPKVLTTAHWGLIPSFIKTNEDAHKIRVQTINARSETVFEKASFKQSILKNRCVLFMDGFFEYQHIGKEKIPYYIYPSNEELFLMGGIYNDWTNTQSGEVFSTFSILTTDANPLMQEIHNSKKRMPLILDKEDARDWLLPKTDKAAIDSLLQVYSDNKMNAHRINKALVSPKQLDPGNAHIIDPYIENTRQQGSLF